MESRVFSFFAALFSRIAVWFDESACGKYYNKFCAWLNRVYQKSFVSRFFAGPKHRDVFQNSVLGKLFGLPGRFLLFLQNKLSGPFNHVLKNSLVCVWFSKWADVSIRFYGFVLCAFSLPLLFLRESGRLGLLLIAAVFAAGIVMILLNRSLRQLFGGSAVVTALMGLFTTPDTTSHESVSCGKAQTIAALGLGLLLSFFCLAFGVKLLVILTGGVLAFAFLLKYLSLGVFLTVALSPMLPTMALVGLSLICALVFCVHVITDKGFTFVKNPMNTFVVFFIIALLWGCINSFSFAASASQAAVHISFILFYFIVVNTIRTRQQWTALIKLFLLSAFAVAAYGVLQNFTGVSSTESWLDEEMFEDIKVRVYSFFNNPNVLGEFLVMTIPLTAAVIWGNMREEHKALFGFVLLSMVACMIFTWSRGAWLGVFLACALFFVIMDKRWVFVGVIALLVLPILLVLSGNTAILERLISVGNTSDSSTAYRVAIWQAAIKMIRDFWISGIGIGSEAFKMVYPVYSLSGADFALHSHNLYLQVWVESGIIGISALLAMTLMFVKQVFSSAVISARKTDSGAKIVIALGAGFLGFMFQGLTDYVWYNYKILMIYWIIIALAICGVNLMSKSSVDEGGVSVK